MSELADKFLRSGLIDKHTAALLEKYSIIEPGEAEKVPEGNPLAEATKAQLTKLAEELAFEAEKDQALKETILDLEKLRWPVTVTIINPQSITGNVAVSVGAVIDRMGRYYFRAQDVKEAWFVPGYVIRTKGKAETIIEVTPLYIGDALVCYQVSTYSDGQ